MSLNSYGGVRLRALEPTDVDLLYRWENDPGVWPYGCTLAPYSRKQLWEYIDTYVADPFATRQLRLMITLGTTGEAVGTVDLYDVDAANSRAGVGIFITPEYRHSGLATMALLRLVEYCRDRLSLHQLYAVIAVDNQPSRRLFEACGFAPSGRLKSWLKTASSYRDAYLYQQINN